MSRASWYRHGKPAAKPRLKITRKRMAEALGVSLRTIQRGMDGRFTSAVERALRSGQESRKAAGTTVEPGHRK